MSNSKRRQKYASTASDTPPQPQAAPQPAQGHLDFVVRPRFGSVKIASPSNGQLQQQPQLQSQSQSQSVPLSSLYTKVNAEESQAEVLGHLGIRLVARNRVKLDLQEFPPNFANKQQQQQQQQLLTPPQQQQQQLLTPPQQQQQLPGGRRRSSGTSSSAEDHHQHALPPSIELHETFTTRNPVPQPLDIRASHLGDGYTEGDTAFACLLEASSPYGERYSIPVLGRGSFSYLADVAGKSNSNGGAGQREHCITGETAGFVQRAALAMSALLCLCELSKEEDMAVVEFYRKVDKTYGYGFTPYLNYLLYCCQTSSQSRDTYLKYLCLEWNNSFSKDSMTQALTHFVKTRQPTPQYFKEVRTAMSQEELANDRQVHFSVRGKATMASMYLKNASRQHLACCPCHVM